MTKVTILGQEPTEKKELKKIEFIKQISGDVKSKNIIDSIIEPYKYDYIELISKSYNTNLYFDIMFAYDEGSRDCGIIFLGHFNDGIV